MIGGVSIRLQMLKLGKYSTAKRMGITGLVSFSQHESEGVLNVCQRQLSLAGYLKEPKKQDQYRSRVAVEDMQ